MGWKETLAAVAPLLGNAVMAANPIAGLAIKAASSALLGKPDGSQDEVAAAVMGASPAQLLSLREADNKFKLDVKAAGLGHLLSQEKERTTRHANDMKSDSWLSKNIRPGTLIYLIIAFSVLAVTDGNIGTFAIKAVYVTAIIGFLEIVLGFYFVGRSVEKAVKIFKGVN